MKTTRTTSTRRTLLAGAIVGLMAATSHAAMITWGAATNISGDTDVSTTGSLVYAYHLTTSSGLPTTVNGVTFLPLDPGVSSIAVTPTLQPLSPSYRDLLATALVLPADTLVTFIFSGLIIGQAYEYQTWASNPVRQNGPNFLFPTSVGDGAGNEVELYAGDDGTTRSMPPVPGQWVIGTFTADAVTQDVTYINGEISGWVNALQLRQLAPASTSVPDGGGTLALFGLALVGLWAFARQTQRSLPGLVTVSES